MGVMKRLSMSGGKFPNSGGGGLITLDSSGLQDYITHLKKLSYNEMNNGVKSIVRQVANDIKRVYLGNTPRRQSGGRTGKYGATPGNLQRSLRVFAKRQKDPFIVEFTVGFKTYKDLQARVKAGKRANDGYYAFMLNEGLEGRGKMKRKRMTRHVGFIQDSRDSANKIINREVSERVTDFIHKKLDKMLKAS